LNDIPVYVPLSGTDLAERPLPPYRVKGIFPQYGLAAIYGPSTSGKSFLAIDLACAIALGNDWFGHRVKQADVMYVALEGEQGFGKRTRAWQQYNEHPIPDRLQFTDAACVRQLATVIKRGSTVIIDTLNRSASGMDENSSKDMGELLAGCKLLQSLIGGLVILIHHTGKDETKGLRGHSSLLAALDAAIEVQRDGEDRSWLVAKAKDDGDGIAFSFRLNVEELGVDEDGDPYSSCAISALTEVAVPTSTKKGLKGNQRIVLEAITVAFQSCSLMTRDDAYDTACDALTSVDSQHRRSRAMITVNSLIKSGKLKFDTDTQLVSLP
jgi:putative DNA primase/helicase